MLARFMQDMVAKAGRHLKSMSSLPIKKERKGANDFVTDADRQAAAMITADLTLAYPHDRIMCEDLPEEGEGGQRYLWIIDPLDGTTNFLHGYPSYSVSLARYDRQDRCMVASAIYNPAMDQLFEAYGREPSTLNGRPLEVSDNALLSSCLVLAGMSHRVDESSPDVAMFSLLSAVSSGTRRSGCASMDICYVAAGFADAYVHLNLKPWDTAAAAHILFNAGGTITNFNSSWLDLGARSFIATNGHCHGRLQEKICRFHPAGPTASGQILVTNHGRGHHQSRADQVGAR